MDTSETYIKMCEKAEEIQPVFEEDDSVGGTFIGGNLLCHHQSNWERQHGKVPEGIFYVLEEPYTDICPTCCNEDTKSKVVKTIWLPDQAQLQAMVQPNDMSARTLLSQFAPWSEQQKHDIANAFASMEQLWLAFVMKERYSKTWNGEDWIKNG